MSTLPPYAGPRDPRCGYTGCLARYSKTLRNQRPGWNGWYWVGSDVDRDNAPTHDHQAVDPYLVANEQRWADLVRLAGNRTTPPIVHLDVAGLRAIRDLHQKDCPTCDGEEHWAECVGFCQARLRGICAEYLVVSKWHQPEPDGDFRLDVWVVLQMEGGSIAYDRIGPFPSLPDAYLWAATVAAAEIARETEG